MPDSHVSAAKVLNAVTQTAELGVSGYGGVAFQIQGTFSATVTFEATVHGSDWVAFSVTEPDNTTRVTTATAPGVFIGSTVGLTAVRARMSAWSSGGASVIIRADVASPGGSGGGGGVGSDVNLISVGGEAIELGQAAMAASVPVTMASDQGPIDVNITGGGGSGGTASTYGAAFPATGTAVGVSDPDGTMQPISAETFDYDSGAGTVAVTALGVAIPASGGPVAVLGGNGTAAQALRVTVASDSTGTSIVTQSTATNLKTQSETYQGGVAVSSGAPLQVTLANTGANATSVKVEGAGVTGTPSGGIVTVQGTLGGKEVPISGTVTANQSGTWNIAAVAAVFPGTGATNLGKAEDAAHTTGDVGVMALAVANEAQSTFAADADYTPLAVDTKGNTFVRGSGTAGTAATGVVTVQGIASMTPVQVSQATASNLNATVVQGTATNLKAEVIGAGAAGTANTGVVTIQGIAGMTKVLVTPDANSAVNLAQVGGTTVVNGGVAGSQSVGGTVATNVAITANPVNLGAQAVSSENAAVTTARQVQLVADLVGKLIVLPYANPENFVSGTITSAMTGTTSTSLVAAPASGLRNYITQITVSNGSTTVPTDILIQDGSGGTTLYVIPCPAGTGTGTGASGATLTFPTPLRQPTTATAIFVANVTTGSSTKVSASGYKGA